MRSPISVAWVNHRGDHSKTHYAYNLEQAACGEFLHENFHVVPDDFGERCTACPERVLPVLVTNEGD